MRLLVKSRKKYHGSIIKCYRSIIKDSTIHEKKQFKHRKKDSLNSTKTLKSIAQKRVRYLGTRCPHYGQ